MQSINFIDLQKHRLKRVIQQGFDALGLEIQQPAPVVLARQQGKGITIFGVKIRARPVIFDLRAAQGDQPTFFDDLLYHLEAGHTFLANIAVQKCRHLWGYISHDTSPLTLAARELVQGDSKQAHALLTRFYASFQPRTAAETVGLETKQHLLMDYGPLGAPIPWGSLSPTRVEKVRTLDYMTDNKRNGQFNFSRRFGPAAHDEVSSEIQRLQELILSIRNNGYQRHEGTDGDISGQLLLDDRAGHDEWSVLLIGGGVHRAAVLAATGSEVLPVRINHGDFVCRSAVASWPQVTSGVYTVDEALSVFDRIITASPPPAYHWSPNLNKQ